MALRDIIEPYFVGAGGRKVTPEQLERERKLAQSMISAGVDFSPVGHWTQGAARMMSALAGNIKQARADNAEKAGIEDAAKKFAGLDLGSLLGGGAAYPSAVAGGASPTSGAATGTTIASTPQAAEIKQGLEARGLPPHVADAFVMNFQDESGLNPGINEKNPIVPGSRGGYGLYQLTGPRRVAYEQFAQQRGVDPSNTDAQLDFLMTELQGPEARAAKSILSAPDTATAAQAIVNDFLRPAPEHRAARAAKYAKAGGVQVASLDPSIGMAQAYAAEPQPQTAAAAINQIAPQQPAPEAKISDALLRQNDMALGGALAPQGAAPQQVADASGYFPAAPSADSAPIMGSYAAPRQGGVNIQQLLEAASDPWMNDAQRSVIGMALKQQMQQNDPMRALQAQKLQLEMDALRAKPQTEYGFTTLPDGTVLRTDKRSGNAEPIYSAGQKPTSVMQNLEAAGLVPGSPEYREAILQSVTKPQTQVNMAGEKAWDTESAKLFAKRYDDISAGAANAQQMMGMYDLAEQAMNSGVRTGLGAEAELNLRQLGAAMGVDTDPEKLAGGELIRAVQNRMALTMRSPDGGMGMPGSLSDRDIKFLKDSQIGIDRSPQGNRKMLEAFRAMEGRKIEIARLADQYIAENGRLDSGFNKMVREWASANPLFPESPSQSGNGAPEGVDPTVWSVMTPEERALWQN